MGINAQVSIDIEKLQDWKESTVQKLVAGILQLCRVNKVHLLHGEARFLSKNEIQITDNPGTSTLEFESAIIATASFQTEPPGIKIDEDRIMSSTGALSLRRVPKKIVIVGAGAVGLEIGMAYANLFGTKLVIIEFLDQLLPGIDKDLLSPVLRSLERLEAKVLLKSTVKAVDYSSEGIIVRVSTPDGELNETADFMLVATGRRPTIDNIGLESLGIELDPKKFIKVDQRQRTNISNIYAIGDVVGGQLLAHKASREGIVAAETIAGLNSSSDRVVIPSAIFTDPEIATVGLSPSDLVEKKIEVRVGKFPFQPNGRAMTATETEGFAKIIADKETKMILAAEVVGEEASDIISEASLAIHLGAKLEDVVSTVRPHPTFSEVIMEAAENALGKAIHIQNRGVATH